MSEDNQEKDKKDRPWKHRSNRLQDWKQARIEKRLEVLNRLQFGQRGFLRPQILELFQQQPMNGVDIMDRLQEMSRGWYRPSPGSVYPLLEQLEKEGLIAKNKEGKFELTRAFAEQAGVADDVARALSTIESNTSYLEDMQRADLARLARSRDRIEKLAKRLESLRESVGSGREEC